MKKDKLIPLLLISIPIIFLIILGSGKKEEVSVTKNQVNNIDKTIKSNTANNETKILPYEYKIIHELSNVRFDNGKIFYILIDPIDLKDVSFKDKIKSTIKDIVSKKGSKISIDVLDNKETLELYYKSHYASNTLGRILNKSELYEISIHLIASYSGNEIGMLYKNQLDFFLGSNKDNQKVGKYVETIEFDASK